MLGPCSIDEDIRSLSNRLTRLPPHPPVNRHAGHPQWEMVLRLVRCTLGALSRVADEFTAEELEWMTIEAATAYFDTLEAEHHRTLGAVDAGRTVN